MLDLNKQARLLFCLLLSPAFIGIAIADDCSPHNPSDCERTTGYQTGLAVGGTLAAMGGALYGGSLGAEGSGEASDLDKIFGPGNLPASTPSSSDPGGSSGMRESSPYSDEDDDEDSDETNDADENLGHTAPDESSPSGPKASD
jgi:hypothetical protein